MTFALQLFSCILVHIGWSCTCPHVEGLAKGTVCTRRLHDDDGRDLLEGVAAVGWHVWF